MLLLSSIDGSFCSGHFPLGPLCVCVITGVIIGWMILWVHVSNEFFSQKNKIKYSLFIFIFTFVHNFKPIKGK
jgi:hypothetical protein